jgi:hypothetical protein
MERKLASVQEIVNIQPIENAEKIEVATVLGWQVVVAKKDNFKVGDKIVYIEIDSIVPEQPEFEFLRDRKFRVRTIKLRGQISQGLIVPISILPKGKYKIGDDVTKELKIVQYIPESEKEGRGLIVRSPKSKIFKYAMRFKWFRWIWKKFNKPQSKGFPSWITKTDEERIQSNPSYLKDKERLYYSTIKMDGSSMTMAVKDKEFVICSRNIKLDEKHNNDSNYVKIAKKINYKDVLTKIKDEYKATTVILQGEMCGPNIQGNKYQLTDLKLFVFNLIIDGKRIPTYDIRNLFVSLNINLRTVPLVPERFLAEKDEDVYTYMLPDTVDEMLDRAKGNSLYYSTTREGIVVRSVDQQVSFKVINNEFLLKEDE